MVKKSQSREEADFFSDSSDNKRGVDHMEQIKRWLREQNEHHQGTRPLVVAIDGLSGSGKTTLVSSLADETTYVFHIDDYIVERTKRYDTGEEEAYEYYALQWDVASIRQVLFEPLSQGVTNLNLPYYDKENDCIVPRHVNLDGYSCVLIEGVFLQRPEWQGFVDSVVYLDCPRSIRYDRVLKRDAYIGDLEARRQKYERRYWPAERAYETTIQPKRRATICMRIEGEESFTDK